MARTSCGKGELALSTILHLIVLSLALEIPVALKETPSSVLRLDLPLLEFPSLCGGGSETTPRYSLPLSTASCLLGREPRQKKTQRTLPTPPACSRPTPPSAGAAQSSVSLPAPQPLPVPPVLPAPTDSAAAPPGRNTTHGATAADARGGQEASTAPATGLSTGAHNAAASSEHPVYGCGGGSGGGLGAALRDYLDRLNAEIQRHKSYPARALHLGLEGEVKLGFLVGRDGVISGIQIVSSSGCGALDEAAVSTLQRIRRFPPLPASIEAGSLRLELPLAYQLEH
ncbi:MAG: energy transducer TonB [Pseudomonadota bacterium]